MAYCQSQAGLDRPRRGRRCRETSFLLATRPELVEQDRLDGDAPWYCGVEGEERTSWSANAGHGQAMVDAVVDA